MRLAPNPNYQLPSEVTTVRIYKGWKVRSLSPETAHVDGAEIVHTTNLRGIYRYTLKMTNGERRSVRREHLLESLNSGLITFTV